MAEMDKLLEKYNLPRLKQEEIENMNQTMTTTKIEHMIKKKTKKKTGPDGFTGKFSNI